MTPTLEELKGREKFPSISYRLVILAYELYDLKMSEKNMAIDVRNYGVHRNEAKLALADLITMTHMLCLDLGYHYKEFEVESKKITSDHADLVDKFLELCKNVAYTRRFNEKRVEESKLRKNLAEFIALIHGKCRKLGFSYTELEELGLRRQKESYDMFDKMGWKPL